MKCINEPNPNMIQKNQWKLRTITQQIMMNVRKSKWMKKEKVILLKWEICSQN